MYVMKNVWKMQQFWTRGGYHKQQNRCTRFCRLEIALTVLRDLDSNQDDLIQSQAYCHYMIPQGVVKRVEV